MTKKKENTNIIMQDIIDNQNEKIRMLEGRIETLKEQLETAYGVNAGLMENQDSDEGYVTLTKVHTLILVLMGLVRSYCNGSEFGDCIENAVKNYYCDMAKALARHTDFGFGNKEDETFDDDEFGEEDGEKEF
jgi:hypothetical protein